MASLSNLSNSYHSAAAHLKNAQAWLLSLSGSSITSVNSLLASIPNALAGNGSTPKERAQERVRLAEQRSVERLSSRDPSQELSPLVKKAGAIAMAAGVYYVGNKAADQLAAMVEAIPSRLNFQTPGDECLIEKIENPGVKPQVDAEKAQSRPKKSEGKQRQAMAPLYHTRPETWNLDRAKAPGLNDRKRVHIDNIEPFAIDQPRGAFARVQIQVYGRVWYTWGKL